MPKSDHLAVRKIGPAYNRQFCLLMIGNARLNVVTAAFIATAGTTNQILLPSTGSSGIENGLVGPSCMFSDLYDGNITEEC